MMMLGVHVTAMSIAVDLSIKVWKQKPYMYQELKRKQSMKKSKVVNTRKGTTKKFSSQVPLLHCSGFKCVCKETLALQFMMVIHKIVSANMVL
ncbi:hypothetical protein EJ110_NYTH54685 [Nymphaea thermarum]|nr:hypothetical protein EJ110_NYTH54685 [Nymphaea thermarum]